MKDKGEEGNERQRGNGGEKKKEQWSCQGGGRTLGENENIPRSSL